MKNLLAEVASMLRDAVGLDGESISERIIAQCVEGRMFLLGLRDAQAYLDVLRRNKEELDDLINAVVVPETWFFRDHAPFEFLRLYVREEWMPAHPAAVLRILSIPCATGEEPYSIAMALIELGLERDRFSIEAVDISKRALARARQGLYNRHSFRGASQARSMRYFEETPAGFQLRPDILQSVRFIQANAMDFAASAKASHYDLVFCRNLLIYLNEPARRSLVSNLDRALKPEGLFFLGHAEAPCVFLPAYEPALFPGSFAVRKRPLPPQRIVMAPANAPAGFPPAAFAPPPAPVFCEPPPPAPLSPEKALEQARLCADRGDYAQARHLCSDILKKEPLCAEAFYISGVAALAAGDEASALDCFHKTLYLEPSHEEARVHVSLLTGKRGLDTTDGRRQMAMKERAL